MPRPLLDRMEIIRLSGYTEDEKLQIVKQHLLKKQMKAAGLKAGECTINDMPPCASLIRYYTREAGVRNLEREIANICRKAIKEILMKGKGQDHRHGQAISSKYAGVQKFRYGEIEEMDRVGHVNGLAYTEFGGDLLSIEAVTMPGKDGKVSTTGNIKEVMKESITVAEMLIKIPRRAIRYRLQKTKREIHSRSCAGRCYAKRRSVGGCGDGYRDRVSTLTGIEVRRDIAMTGEVNLRGYVTPIGGLKEKLLGGACAAASRKS